MTNDNSALLIQQSCKQLLAYIEKEQYRGYDPYDALLSPLFGLPVLNNNKLFRFGIQQLVKRSPINLRAILQIKKGINPVTLGLCIQGYTNLAQANLISKDEAIKNATCFKTNSLNLFLKVIRALVGAMIFHGNRGI
ncbi:MAG: hypothetical protein IPP71_08505 [Bacteroidetes bacterium]|nr:hypothetical protein [Bacteroidota bacterium]